MQLHVLLELSQFSLSCGGHLKLAVLSWLWMDFDAPLDGSYARKHDIKIGGCC